MQATDGQLLLGSVRPSIPFVDHHLRVGCRPGLGVGQASLQHVPRLRLLGGLGSLAEPHTMACVRWSGGSGFVPGLGVMVSVVLDLPACPPACRPACGWVSRYAPPAPHPPHAPDSPTARAAPAPPAPHPRSPAPPGPPPQPGPALRRVRILPWSAMCVDGRCGGGRRRRHILRSVLQDHKIIALSASAGDQKVNTGGTT